METYYSEVIEYIVYAIFYGLEFGIVAGFISPLYNWFRRL